MFGGFWIDQEPELHEKMKAIEKEHKCKVYAVTHEYTEFGELYDLMDFILWSFNSALCLTNSSLIESSSSKIFFAISLISSSTIFSKVIEVIWCEKQ